MRKPLAALAVVAAVAVAALAGGAPGCSKESESLILVNVQATDTSGAGQSSLEITVSEPAPSTKTIRRVFDLPMPPGLPMSPPVQFGVYIPAGIKDSLPIKVVARPTTGCNGYTGRGSAKLNPGGTVTVTIMMGFEDVCMLAGTAGSGGGSGAAGAGGSTGAAGNAGTAGTTGGGGSIVTGCPAVGTPPAAVMPPTLTSCTEYDHNPAGLVCNPSSSDIDNPFINDVAVSPDGQLLATSGTDYFYDGTVKIWRMQGNTPIGCGPLFSMTYFAPAYIAFSPNGQYFAIAWLNDYVYIYRVPSFTFVTAIKSSTKPLYGVGFSPDSQTVFSIEYDSTLVDGTLFADRLDGTAITSRALGVDPDRLAVARVAVGGATQIAVAGYYGNAAVYTWDGATLSAPTILPTAADAHALAIRFTPNGQLLAVGTDDGVVRFWTIPAASTTPSGSPINLGPTNTVRGLSFSPGGDYIAIAAGAEVDVWNVTTRMFVSRRNLTPPAGATGTAAFSVAFSASGGAVVTGEGLCGKVLVCSD